MSNNDRKMVNCNYIKMILMISIVFYHSIAYWKGDWFIANGVPVYEAKWLKILAEWLAYILNSSFVLISGYIYSYIKVEKKGYNNLRKFIITKAKRLLVPCYFGILITIPFAVYYYKFAVKDIIVNYFLGCAPSHMWFLMMLFNVFLIANFLIPLWDKSYILGVTSVVIFYLLGSIVSRALGDYFQIPGAFQYLSVFYIGFNIRKSWFIYLEKIPLCAYLATALIVYSLYKFTCSTDSYYKILNYALKFLHINTSSVMVFMIMQYISNHINWQNKVNEMFINCSMSIYIFHHSIVWIMISLWNGMINPYLHAVLTFLVSMVISLLLSFVCLKYKLTRFMIGMKS